MAHPLKLEILLGAIDKATAPLNRIHTSATQAAEQLRLLKQQERALKSEQRDVSGYRTARVHLRQHSRQLKQVTEVLDQHRAKLDAARHAQRASNQNVKLAQREYRRLSDKILDSRDANSRLITELEKARVHLTIMQQGANRTANDVAHWTQQVNHAEGEQQRLSTSTAKLTHDIAIYDNRLRQSGLHTDQMASVTHHLKHREDQLTVSLTKQQQQLEKLHAIQTNINKARNEQANGLSTRNQLALTGAGATATAVGLFQPLKAPLIESKRYQNEVARIDALGQGTATTEAARQFVHTHAGYGVSEHDSLVLMRDALSVFGSEAHAEIVTPILQKMQFANRARYGDEHSENNERLFIEMLKAIELRGGVNDPTAFARQANMVQQVINATGGRVNADEWMHLIKTGGIAVKGLTDEAFYYKLEPLVQEMGGDRVGTGLMSTYQNLYQGRTTKAAAQQLERLGLIGDKTKVTYDTIGQEAYVGPGALKGGELFKKDIFGWVDTVLLPQLAKAGITSQQHILDAVGSIITNRTGASIISGYIQQQHASQRRAELNARADGIDQMYLKARNQVQGKELELAARRADLYKTLGDTLLPAYTKALEKATHAIQSLSHWMQQHPKAAKVMFLSLAGFGVLIGLFGTLSLALASLLGPLVMVRYLLKMLRLNFGKVASTGHRSARSIKIVGQLFTRFGQYLIAVKSVLSHLRPMITRVATLLGRILVTALMSAGRALLLFSAACPLLTAIGLIITALAYAAYKIYTHWNPIKGFFIQLWASIKQVFQQGIDTLRQYWENINSHLSDGWQRILPAITSAASQLWQQLTTVFTTGITQLTSFVQRWQPWTLFRQLFTQVITYLCKQLPDAFHDSGLRMMKALGSGILAGIGFVKEKLRHIKQSLIQWLPKGQEGTSSDEGAPSLPKQQLIFKQAAKSVALTGLLATPALAASAMPSSPQFERLPELTHAITPLQNVRFDQRPAISAQPAPASHTDQRQFTINIHPTPGMDPHAIADAIRHELNRRDYEQQANARASLFDRG